MIIKYGDDYINTNHIVEIDLFEGVVRFVNGSTFRQEHKVLKKLLEIWLEDESNCGVLYKEINVEHPTIISVSEVTENDKV